MNARETRTLEAFLRAISGHTKPIPTQIQQEIRRIGQDLHQRDTQSLGEIPKLVKQDADLQQQYEQIYRQLQSKYVAQERTKSLSINSNTTVSLDNEIQLSQIMTSDDLIDAIQHFLIRLDQQSSVNLQSNSFWERGTRIVTLGGGGAFLGVLLAQFPGAIIGGILASIYAWFSAENSTKSSSAR